MGVGLQTGMVIRKLSGQEPLKGGKCVMNYKMPLCLYSMTG